MDQNPCAVVDCENGGRSQICPFDDRYHHHGRIHYPTDQKEAEGWGSIGLAFRPLSEGWGWLLICDEHYKVVREDIDRRREQRYRKGERNGRTN